MARPASDTLLGAFLFVAVVATVVNLGPALAHVFELPNKIGLDRDRYFTVQAIYRGWNLFAFVLLVQLVAIVGVMAAAWRAPRMLWPAVLALAGLVGAQALFWVFTFPANTATQNWTVPPGNWEELRVQWEYSHAGGAAFQMLALAALVVAALRYGRE